MYQKIEKLISEQLDIKSLQYLGNPKGVDYLVPAWKRVSGRMQADMRNYTRKLEPIAQPTTDLSHHEIPAFRGLLAQVKWPVKHVLGQIAYSVSKTAQKTDDYGARLMFDKSTSRRGRGSIQSWYSGQCAWKKWWS